MKQEEIFQRTAIERMKSDEKWGTQSIPNGTHSDYALVTILLEEVGEVARAVLERDEENLRDELFDVMQVATAWLEAL